MIDNPDFSPVWNNLGKVEAISMGDAQNARDMGMGIPISLWPRGRSDDTLGSRGYIIFIDTGGSRKGRVNEVRTS